MLLLEHHFDGWKVVNAKATGRYRFRTKWYGRLVVQIEEVVAFARDHSFHEASSKTEIRWRDLKSSELKDKFFVCLQ